MDVGAYSRRARVPQPPVTAVILLDTNAVIWLHGSHRRATPLKGRGRLYVSPATVLELQFLIEAGRLRLSADSDVSQVTHDDRYVIDDPSSAAWFAAATTVSWTRDPFDRLLVAHARIRKWRLATGDRALIEHLGEAECFAL
jgi:PIN domain nuclease of toxin-antitoxin system